MYTIQKMKPINIEHANSIHNKQYDNKFRDKNNHDGAVTVFG